MRRLLLLLSLLIPASVSAQTAPIIGTTLKTTSTATTSIQVGCAVGSSVCTGGIVAGPIDVTSVTSGGFIGIASNVPASTTYRLYNNAGTLTWNGVALATGASLSGTLNTIPVFTAANAVGNSIMTQSGTTITVASTLNATTLGGTLSTATQNSVTTMTGLTTVGTIGTGVWQGTLIGLTYGGTGANLSGTGGTSQFLRQNTVGGAVTVVRPAVADLSDASNVALLNAANTFTHAAPISLNANGFLRTDVAGWFALQGGSSGYRWSNNANNATRMELSDAGLLTVSGFGAHAFSAGGTGGNLLNVSNSTSGAGNYAHVSAVAGDGATYLRGYSTIYTPSGSQLAAGSELLATGAGGLSVTASHASGAIRLYSGGTTQRFGIDASGNWLKGTSIMDSTGTPTIGASNFGGGSVAGNDYAFVVTQGAASSAGGDISFGRTWTTAPTCSVSMSVNNVGGTAAVSAFTSITTTALAIAANVNYVSGTKYYILCRGY